MKTLLLTLVAVSHSALLAAAPPQAAPSQAPPSQGAAPARPGKYTIVVEGYDWGAGVSKVVLALDEKVSKAAAGGYTVSVKRSTPCLEIPAEQAAGDRVVVDAYVSDAKGQRLAEGTHVTLVLVVAPQWPIASPLQFVRNEKCRGNQWIDYAVTVTEKASGRVWSEGAGRISPIVDRFDVSGTFEDESGVKLTYAHFAPAAADRKHPLIIWLHGGGEGGTDPTIPLLANKATSYASDEVQTIFGGAHVLVPQTPGAWMHNKAGEMTGGREDDIYNAALMELIQQFVASRPAIDPTRVYVGGCSNGGYMALKLILKEPGYFAAGYISALAYQSQYLSDEQVKSVAHVPIWFVHSADDTTTRPEATVLPVYERLKAQGAKDVHLSYYDHVVDITGFFGGAGYRYNGHWSWIYSHANQSRLDFDGKPVNVGGRPVTILEWLAAQQNPRR